MTRGAKAPRHGRIAGDVWRKDARASVHALREPRAWALDCADLARAEACGAVMVCIVDLESGREFWASLAAVRSHGFTVSRGAGAQVALRLERWAPSRDAVREAEAEQLSLAL